MAAMEVNGIPHGAHLQTGPMTMAKLQMCAHNADVEEVIELKDTVNIGHKNNYQLVWSCILKNYSLCFRLWSKWRELAGNERF